VVTEAIQLAEKIASHSPLVVQMAKEAVNAGIKPCLFVLELCCLQYCTVCYISIV